MGVLTCQIRMKHQSATFRALIQNDCFSYPVLLLEYNITIFYSYNNVYCTNCVLFYHESHYTSSVFRSATVILSLYFLRYILPRLWLKKKTR